MNVHNDCSAIMEIIQIMDICIFSYKLMEFLK